MREADEGDVGFICDLFELPHARAFLNRPGQAVVEASLEDPNVENYIVESKRGEPLGNFVLRNHGFLIEFSVLVVDPPGKGTGTFALRWGIDHAFGRCKAHRIALEIREDNVRTRALCERLGFVAEGLFRDGFKDAVTGRYVNLVPYAMLRPART